MMNINLYSSQLQALEFAWTSCRLRNLDTCCGLVHDGPHQCLKEIFHKFLAGGKLATKYYLMFHLIPMLLRLRKVKEVKKVPSIVLKALIDYVKSCLFLSFLVGFFRLGLCVNFNQSPSHILSFQNHMYISNPLGSVAILFEQGSRQTDVSSYLIAKALRSVYLVLKRTYGLKFQSQVTFMHVAIMSMLFYIYNHHPQSLKFRNLFVYIFGDE